MDGDLGDLSAMKKEIADFRVILEENRIDEYNPDYHLTKEEISKLLGVSVNGVNEVSKRWEDIGAMKKVNIRYQTGRRGVGYILQEGWREKIEKDFQEN